jgi:hypothetical protein
VQLVRRHELSRHVHSAGHGHQQHDVEVRHHHRLGHHAQRRWIDLVQRIENEHRASFRRGAELAQLHERLHDLGARQALAREQCGEAPAQLRREVGRKQVHIIRPEPTQPDAQAAERLIAAGLAPHSKVERRIDRARAVLRKLEPRGRDVGVHRDPLLGRLARDQRQCLQRGLRARRERRRQQLRERAPALALVGVGGIERLTAPVTGHQLA